MDVGEVVAQASRRGWHALSVKATSKAAQHQCPLRCARHEQVPSSLPGSGRVVGASDEEGGDVAQGEL